MADEDSSLSEDEYYVEKVLDKKVIDGEINYLVKWEGWSLESSTWEPVNNLKNIPNLIEAFEKEKKDMRKALNNGKATKSAEKGNSAQMSLSKKKARPKGKEEEETEEKSQSQLEMLVDLDFNIPKEIVSVKREKNQLLCQVRFMERSN